MYGLDINFLNDRSTQLDESTASAPTIREESNWRPTIVGAAVGLTPLVLVLGTWLFLNSRINTLEARRDEINAELAAQQSTQEELISARERAQQAEDDARALVTVFDQIKPWSAVLQSIQDNVPSGVRIAGVEQSAETEEDQSITISGYAVSFDDVNDFELVLRRSPFIDAEGTQLETASLTDYPVTFELPEDASSEIDVRPPEVVEYTISANLTDLPASQLLAELESTLAVGLTSRIQALRDRGAFE
ncbi:MAG: PilN domain-containing protein [Elainellaceae cyanobacterium]